MGIEGRSLSGEGWLSLLDSVRGVCKIDEAIGLAGLEEVKLYMLAKAESVRRLSRLLIRSLRLLLLRALCHMSLLAHPSRGFSGRQASL